MFDQVEKLKLTEPNIVILTNTQKCHNSCCSDILSNEVWEEDSLDTLAKIHMLYKSRKGNAFEILT